MTERITVIGAGTVGANLARAFRAAGNSVRLGARDTASPRVQELAVELGASVVPIEAAGADTDVVVLAVPHDGVVDAAGAIDWSSGAIAVDVTNPVGTSLPASAASTLDLLADAGVEAPLVKAFNTIGAEAFVAPAADGSPVFLPVAGETPAAERVAALARSIGFDSIVIGDRGAAALNESFAELWIHLALRRGLGRNLAFRRVER